MDFEPFSFDSSFSSIDAKGMGFAILPDTVVPADTQMQQLECSSSEFLLNPTPISDSTVTIVQTVPLASAPWLNNESFLQCLRPLLSNNASFLREGITQLQGYNEKDFAAAKISNRRTSKRIVSDDDDETRSNASGSFRSKQLEQWNQRFEELVDFKRENGHCNVPLEYPENSSLAHWVKRQRYQFGLKTEGKHSTLTLERQHALEDLGFIWDSHAAGWDLRFNELLQFKSRYGHCNVPTKFPANPPLSIWVKCQRRQFKLFEKKDKSNITPDRIEKLRSIGFVFHPRMHSKMMKDQIRMKSSLY